ncbi:MAG: TPM domain-containing protein [Rhodocyclaceae bacterium]|nr:TPM domain-containing protein [Rhodocyclaceae bacterium]
MNFKRIFRHLFLPHWSIGLAFPKRVLNSIARAVAESEKRHDAELRFAVEAGLTFAALRRGQTARQRAVEVFSQLRVWDTEHNSGVLIYVQLVDRKVEILADRGVSALVPQVEWDAICRRLEQSYRRREFEQGTLAAIDEITTRLARHFPPREANPNELPDRPVIL